MPSFIETLTAATTQKPKPAKFATLPGDAEQSTKPQRQEEIPRESQPASSCAAADTSMQILDPQIPYPARQSSPAEREDSIQKRHRPAEVTQCRQ